jgi:phospholipid/cholesterol/gamma-HCH transport system substrate-binding protein
MTSEGETRLRGTAPIVRVVALFAIAAIAIVCVLLLVGGGGYSITARFADASQLVKGNDVKISGLAAGTVESIRLTRDGQASVKLRIDGDYAPLRDGTRAIIRQASISGVANRYVDLHVGPHGGRAIPDGGTLGQDATTSAVDLDQLFNTFDPKTRKALQGVIQGSANQYEGRGEQMAAALPYLNPSLAASSALFRELNRDSRLLGRFVVASSQLVTDLADRRDDLAGLVDHLATTTTAIGSRQAELSDSIAQLPPVMRRANTTFVNLRAALDDLDPLVAESKPVAKRLRPLLAELRPLARDARPTLRDLAALLRSPGPGNDTLDLLNAQPPLRDVALRPVQEDGKQREGAFPASAKALTTATPEIAFFRPYTTDLLGWFDDFSHSGTIDALGASSRVAIHANAFLLVNGKLEPVPPNLRAAALKATVESGQRNRCPGAAEHTADDKSNPYKPTPDFNCDPSQKLPGD